jgi:hypothetical protein
MAATCPQLPLGLLAGSDGEWSAWFVEVLATSKELALIINMDEVGSRSLNTVNCLAGRGFAGSRNKGCWLCVRFELLLHMAALNKPICN